MFFQKFDGIEAVRKFLTREGSCLILAPHHDVGVSSDLNERAMEYEHHGDRLVPRQQRFDKYTRSLMKGLGVPVENRYIRSFGVTSAFAIGILSAVPYLAALASIVLVGRHSDRTMERRYHSALPCLASALGLIGIGLFSNPPVVAFVALVVAVAGTVSYNGPFWQLPAGMVAGSAAAGGVALINGISSLSGWVGPSVVGWLEDVTGKTTAGLYVVAALEILAAVLILLFIPRLESTRQVRAAVRGAAVQGPAVEGEVLL
jgi:MFS family permease